MLVLIFLKGKVNKLRCKLSVNTLNRYYTVSCSLHGTGLVKICVAASYGDHGFIGS